MSDVIELNVGGTIYCSTSKTLLSEPESIFDSILTESSLVKDSNNKIFIDRDGQIFRFILDFLRNKNKFIQPETNSDKIRLKNEAEYYKLTNLIKLLEERQIDLKIDLPLSFLPTKNTYGCIVVAYRGTFLNGRDGLSDIKFRRISRILISGRVNLCRDVFGETLNESRDPDHGIGDRYTSRYFLKHSFLEQAFDTLLEANFELKAAAGTSALSLMDPKDSKSSQDAEENRWLHYNEFVFVRSK